MSMHLPSAEDILARLVSFDTTSRLSNLDLINYVVDLLNQHGIDSTVIYNKEKSKANLYASVGPKSTGGVMLSGHTDVVPVDGQDWQYPPFQLSTEHGRYYGRGTTDMKGFVACAIHCMLSACKQSLQIPLHLALSYDEEIGCVGVHSLLDMLNKAPHKPQFCIVGEPTSMQVAIRHKGKTAAIAHCHGTEGHSAMAPDYLNAIHLACDFIALLRSEQKSIVDAYQDNDKAEIPYTTIHAGRVIADQALNIVPAYCSVNFEIRHPASDDPCGRLQSIKQKTEALVNQAQLKHAEANIHIETLNAYPALDTPADSEVVAFVQSLLQSDSTGSVAFGTEAGLFSSASGIPAVVCGPGSMEQGHKPDEFLEEAQFLACQHMLEQLIARLVTP